MGHYCRICDRSRPNEKFSGRGHRIHVCKECQRLPRAERDSIERGDELHGFLRQSFISAKNTARLQKLARHEDHQIAELAALILEIARVLPGKRNRWPKLAQRHRPLFNRAVELLGIEYFEDLLTGYGDFESPLWDVLKPYSITPSWPGSACDCGSGRPFQECCMERQNNLADEEVRSHPTGHNAPTTGVLNRRLFLTITGFSATGWALGVGGVGRVQAAAAEARVRDLRVISVQPNYYHGWPTVTRRKNGELLLVYSGGREEHVCPFGRVEWKRSYDRGENWTWPRVLLDSDLDDRDAGVVETSRGTLLVTSFTSLAYEPLLQGARKGNAAWQAAHRRLQPEERQAELGHFGVWGIPSFLLRLRDGRLLMTYGHRRPPLGNQARYSDDEGRTWSDPMIISGDGSSGDLGYPSTVELDDGELLTVWYERLTDSTKAVLRQARWSFAAKPK